MIGKVISHYTITGKLGQGGMGEVYLARDTKLDRSVALKFLPQALWNEAEAQQRLIREAQAASKLDHPNIVTIYGIEESEGRPFIHMAHVQGVMLNEYCTAKRRAMGELIDLALQMADGLQHAHEAGVVHRDLKPSNILVDDRGRVRILDFGIASLKGASRLTQTGMTVGTLTYTAPEIIKGQEAGPASDIYSLGVVLYQMLSGKLPFEADHDAALLYSILNDVPKPLSAHGADVPAGLQRIISRCLEKLPEHRYANCAALTDDLKRARPADTGATGSAAEKPSIAVLPFNNKSADPENEYFSDGLTEELLNVLARIPDLKVTGRTSSFAFKGRHEDLREIGQKLGVGTLLEGSVRKAGNRVRITAQLIKVADGFHLWSETYDRVLDDIFAVQDDIARAVSSAMHVTLLGKPAAAQGSAEGYALILQGNHFVLQNTEPALARAEQLYRQVIDQGPGDARAWSGLARVYAYQAFYGHADVGESRRRARAAAERAVALDDGLADAHEMMGMILASLEFRWEEAMEELRRARMLAPGASSPMLTTAIYEAAFGRLEESLPLVRRAQEIDPLNPSVHMHCGRIYGWVPDLRAARDAYTRAMELSPGMASVNANLGLNLLWSGARDEALAQIQREPSAGYREYALAIAYATLGRHAESDAALARLLAEGEQWAYQFATAYAVRGETDRAFHWLERAYELHDSGVVLTKMNPLFASLHPDPRWPRILEKLGLPA